MCTSIDNCDHGGITAGHVRSPQVGFNDDIDMVYLNPYDVIKRGAATVLRETDCKSTSSRYYNLENSIEASSRTDFSEPLLGPDTGIDDIGTVMVP